MLDKEACDLLFLKEISRLGSGEEDICIGLISWWGVSPVTVMGYIRSDCSWSLLVYSLQKSLKLGFIIN